MRRRQVLAAAASLPAAGCLSPVETGELSGAVEERTARLSMRAVDDRAVAAAVVRSEMGSDERRAVDRIVDDGPVKLGWAQEPPVHAERPVLHDGAVYRLSSSVVETRQAVNFGVKVDVPQETPGPAETVLFADLPAADRAVFEREGFADGEVVGVGTVFTYTPAQVEQSVLVPDPRYRYVRWAGGETAEWVVDDRWETTQQRYRYEAERVASAEAYGRRVREEHAFTLSGLSDAERDVVERAIDAEDGYEVPAGGTPSPAFRGVVDAFRGHQEVTSPDPRVSGSYLARYDGTVYWSLLSIPRAESEDGTGPATGTGDPSTTGDAD